MLLPMKILLTMEISLSMKILWYFFDNVWRIPFSLSNVRHLKFLPGSKQKENIFKKKFPVTHIFGKSASSVYTRVHQVCMQESIKCVCKMMINHTKSFWWKEMLEKFTQLDFLLFSSLWSIGANVLMMNFPNFACVSVCWCKYVCEGRGEHERWRVHLFMCVVKEMGQSSGGSV